jgi:hypothetical protein
MYDQRLTTNELEVGNQGLDILLKRFGHLFVPPLITRDLAGFAAVEVVLSALSAHKLATGRDAEALGDSFLSLLFHRMVLMDRRGEIGDRKREVFRIVPYPDS